MRKEAETRALIASVFLVSACVILYLLVGCPCAAVVHVNQEPLKRMVQP